MIILFKKDKITSFTDFLPDNKLTKKYKYYNIVLSRTDEIFILCIYFNKDYSGSSATIIVHNKCTLTSPLILTAFKDGVKVSLSKILNPNNGLNSYSQFFAAVNSAVNFDISFESSISQAVNILEKSQSLNSLDSTKCKKLNFITRQLQLLLKKDFLTADYCLALELFPRCTYEHLRDYLVLPSKRKLHSISSSTDVDKVVLKTFEKVHNDQQKNCF